MMGRLRNYRVIAVDRKNGERKDFLYAAESERELLAVLAMRYDVERTDPQPLDLLHGRTSAQIVPFAILLFGTLVIVLFALAVVFNIGG